jgi:Putative antitoxin of bacterial toxin-antitoxin system, YdaS/YdaT
MSSTAVEAARFMRGEIMRRSSERRDSQRDHVMKMIFSKPGFASVIARHLNVSHQNVAAWNKVPAHHVLDIAPLIEMTPEEIRPDIFGKRRRK